LEDEGGTLLSEGDAAGFSDEQAEAAGGGEHHNGGAQKDHFAHIHVCSFPKWFYAVGFDGNKCRCAIFMPSVCANYGCVPHIKQGKVGEK
jgi:hypothetical protein